MNEVVRTASSDWAGKLALGVLLSGVVLSCVAGQLPGTPTVKPTATLGDARGLAELTSAEITKASEGIREKTGEMRGMPEMPQTPLIVGGFDSIDTLNALIVSNAGTISGPLVEKMNQASRENADLINIANAAVKRGDVEHAARVKAEAALANLEQSWLWKISIGLFALSLVLGGLSFYARGAIPFAVAAFVGGGFFGALSKYFDSIVLVCFAVVVVGGIIALIILWKKGLLIPRSTKAAAAMDAEATALAKVNPVAALAMYRESIAAERRVDPSYDAAYKDAKPAAVAKAATAATTAPTAPGGGA